MSRIFFKNPIKNVQKNEEEKKKQQEENNYKKEAVVSTEEVMGTNTLDGTGYTSFKDLVTAKRKKQNEFEETRNIRGANNFASLLGRYSTLG